MFVPMLFILIVFIVIKIIVFNSVYSIGILGKKNLKIDVFDIYKEYGANVYFFGKKLNKKIIVEGEINTNKIGKYTIKYIYKGLIFIKQRARVINVVDEEKPTIKLVGKTELVMCPNQTYKEEGYSANDNYDGDVTSLVKVIEKENSIIYEVSDTSMNKNKKIRKITREDKTAPVITLNGKSTYYIANGSKFVDPLYKAVDNCDQNITSKVVVSNNLNTSKNGTYSITYQVTDSSQNKTIVTRKVVVYSNSSKQYTNIIMGPKYIKGILLVNKTYALPSSYNPGVDNKAMSQLKKLQAASKQAGYTMGLLSGFRSYSFQKDLYNYYVRIDGQKEADTYSARPGHSEHQTGLAFDIGDISDNFGNTARGRWLKNNCATYGFIIRYPKGKEKITGYSYEPWHVRYVGIEHAKNIMKSGLTLEEYLGV